MKEVSLQQIWPGWEIVRRIGGGSYGVVYEAVRRDGYVESRAAIKIIHIPQDESEMDSLRSDGLSMDASRTYMQKIVDDFVNEIKLMESLKGIQNVVSIEDHAVVTKQDEIGWTIYIRMELLTPLDEHFADSRPNEQEIIRLGIDICSALERCSERNIIHRDIKPDNILVNQFGDYKLGDFGVARKLENVTSGLSQKGAPNYMAPEIGWGAQYDTRADLYSLGLVMYKYLNRNRLPFLHSEQQLLDPNEREAAIRRRMSGEKLPAPCDASPRMADLILCACDPDPNNRFVSATAMKTALRSLSSGNETIAVRRPRTDLQNRTNLVKTTKTKQGPRFGPINLILLITVSVILAGVIGLLIWRPWKDPEGSEKETSTIESPEDRGKTDETTAEPAETPAGTDSSEEVFSTQAQEASTEGNKGNSPGIAVPGIPENLTAKVMDTTLVRISWQPVGSADYYEVEYFQPEGMKWVQDSSYSGGTYYLSTILANYSEYQYRVRAVNSAGASDWSVVSFEIPAEAAIVITSQPQNWFGEYGETPKITVVAEGEGLSYQWYYKNAGESEYTDSTDKDNCYDSKPLTYIRNGREVYCLITDKYGHTVTSGTAKMCLSPTASYTGPIITQQPKDWSGRIGEIIDMSITAIGKDLTYTWYYQNTYMSKPNASKDTDNNYNTAVMEAEKDGRIVYCVVTDVYGCKVESDRVKVTLIGSAELELSIIKQPEDWYGALGDRTKITVIAQGPGLKYQWYY